MLRSNGVAVGSLWISGQLASCVVANPWQMLFAEPCETDGSSWGVQQDRGKTRHFFQVYALANVPGSYPVSLASNARRTRLHGRLCGRVADSEVKLGGSACWGCYLTEWWRTQKLKEKWPSTRPGYFFLFLIFLNDFNAPKGPRTHAMSPPLLG
jgi:hypothetical protein